MRIINKFSNDIIKTPKISKDTSLKCFVTSEVL